MKLKQANILVVDDDPDVLTAVMLLLKTEVNEVSTEKNPENIRARLSAKKYDVMLLDMNFTSSVNTGNEGFFWLKQIKELAPDMAVIMITAYGGVDIAVRSLKEGADDFIVKPWHNEKLISSISELLASKGEKKSDAGRPRQHAAGIGTELIGQSPVMTDIFRKIEKIASTEANILILGENGTGKDLVAKALHQNSARAKKPYVKVDIGALTESLFESELFGHKKGAFTDAKSDRTGFFEAASGGTLFLDEIGNINLPQQAKLLSVLQNRQVIRLGSNTPEAIDIRLICATNLPLQELANESRFRKDLIYRINTIEIIIPPLRQREDDVVLLAQHFARIYSEKYMKLPVQFDRGALDKLKGYRFPGNVRELQYTIERAVIMADKELLQAGDLIFSPIEAAPGTDTLNGESRLSAVERSTILRVIEKHNGNITKAAKELGITRTALYRRLDKYDI
jgi:two-component system response regulator HydG